MAWGGSGEDGPCVGGGGGVATVVDGVGAWDEVLLLVQLLMAGLVEGGLVVLEWGGGRGGRGGREEEGERRERSETMCMYMYMYMCMYKFVVCLPD